MSPLRVRRVTTGHHRRENADRARQGDRGIVMLREEHPSPQGRGRGADPFGPLGSQHRVAMPITPVITVHPEERGENAQVLHRVELIFPHGLAVNHHVPPAGIVAVPGLGGLHPGNHQVDRRVAIAMDQELPAALVAQADLAQHLIVGQGGKAPVGGVPSVRRHEVGLG